MKPEVIHRDGPLWVIYKPAGMPVHRARGLDQLDLTHWARTTAGAAWSIAPIHRLDRHTSGAVLLSESPEERAVIAGWFAAHEVRKEYLALVYGRTAGGGVIDRALKDDRRKKLLPARTLYEAERVLSAWTLLRVHPETGRKHQIRRHLRGIGHPIVGDPRYGPGRRWPVPGHPGRMWLHAEQLRLPDGRQFISPLPPELQLHLQQLTSSD